MEKLNEKNWKLNLENQPLKNWSEKEKNALNQEIKRLWL